MRAADLVTAAVLMLLGGVVLYDALRLGIRWGLEGPGSGFFPFWLALLLVLITAALIVQAARRDGVRPFATRERITPVLKVVLPVLGFILLTDPPGPWDGVGLYTAAAIYLAFYMRWVGRHGWREVVALSVVVPFVTFLIFERWFLVPMPKGPIEAWFGY
jgi:putative tricarboxylic transport membrane protein